MLQAEQERIKSILQAYWGEEAFEWVPGESGVNNSTYRIRSGQADYVLRVYENHADRAKVEYELEVLRQLAKASLPYATPMPVNTLEGTSMVATEQGKLAVMFHWIDGSRASITDVRLLVSIGEAIARLIGALEKLPISASAAYEPYYDIYHVHPLVTKESLQQWLLDLSGQEEKHAAAALLAAIHRLEHTLPALKKLPVQLVHSDIVYGNILSDGEKVAGILDFEFVTPDLRAMELAVFLSELIKPDPAEVENSELWACIEACLMGYGRIGAMTEEELCTLPQLIALRSLVLVIHFLGREWAGIVDKKTPVDYLHSFYRVFQWMELNEERLIRYAQKHISKITS